MCGIAGFSGNFEPELLPKMIEAVAHRGPDDQGHFFQPQMNCGIAQARLSIIDLSNRAHQPMSNDEQTLHIVFNGEIYNFPELRKRLLESGYNFRSDSDTEVLLHLYAEKGVEMLAELNGVFAFAIIDRKNQQMFIARDHLGVKPLYIANTASGIVFCSEIKGLLACKELKRDIDAAAVNQHLAFIWCPGPRTMFKSVKKLGPGQACLIEKGKITRQWQYYSLPYNGERLDCGHDEILRMVETQLEKSVRMQLIADVPVGAFLSGGLDSSAIVAMMRKINPDKSIRCYSIGFDDDADNEGCPADLPYAEKVAEHLKVDLCKIQVTPEQLIERLAELIWFLDEPQADPAPVNAMFIAEQARRDGIKVLLSGAGGDDIFTGYRRHLAIKGDIIWNLVPAPLRRLLRKLAVKNIDVRNSTMRRLVKVLQYADLEPEQRLINYYKWSQDDLRRQLLSPEIAETAFAEATESALTQALEQISVEDDPINKMLFLDSRFFLPDHNLNYTDKTCMRYGVEARVPLLDPDLVALAAKIPTNFKQTFTQGKAIFKQSMEKYLPREVIYRPKTHFGSPLRRWVRHDLQPVIARLLNQQTLESRGLFSPTAVAQLLNDTNAGRVDGSYIILSLLCIEIWCQLFIDGTAYNRIKI